MADELHVNGTQVGLESVAAPSGGYGYTRVVGLDWGTPDATQFLDAIPLGDGKAFRGSVAQDRKLTLAIYGHDAGSLAKGQDTWLAVLNLLRTNTGPVSLKYVRTDGSGATITRELLVLIQGELPGWGLTPSGAGMRPNGNFLMPLTLIAPFPWWRNYTATTTTLNPVGTGSASTSITRSGTRPCGASIKVSTAGSLADMGVGDGNRTLTMTASFSGTPKGVDWYYADPTATSIDSGVVVSTAGHFSLHSASVTVTAQAASNGASGTHTVTILHKPLWETP